MSTIELIRDHLRVRQLIGLASFTSEANREGLNGLIQRLRHQGHDRAAVQPAAQKRPERNITSQSQSHGFSKETQKLIRILLVGCKSTVLGSTLSQTKNPSNG